MCLLASGARSERSERRRQGSSPEGRRPRKRASWSQSGQSPARRNRARRPVAGRAAAQTRRPGILQDRKTPGSRNKHAYMPIHEEREGRNRKDFCRETRSVGAARQATVRERGRRRRRRRAEGGPGRRERSERGCCCSSGGMKRADRRETTTGSLGRGRMPGESYDLMACLLWLLTGAPEDDGVRRRADACRARA